MDKQDKAKGVRPIRKQQSQTKFDQYSRPTMTSNGSGITDIAEGGTITWIGDGSERPSVLEVVKSDEYGNSETMTAKSATTGTPFNVRCSHGFSPSATSSGSSMHIFSFQINQLEGNVAVGIVSHDEFKPGWKTKGMFYNGNVTNGSASLITGFGKYVQSGDLVRVIAKKTTSDRSSSGSLDVIFSINDDVLGTAFSITDPEILNGNKTFYPCIHVSGKVTFSYSVAEVPDGAGLMFNNNNEEPEPRTNFLGQWKIESMDQTDGSAVELPSGHDIVVSLSSSSKTSSDPDRISIKVGNTIGGPLQLEDGSSSSSSPTSMNVKIGPNLMSTMMMPPPELYALEQTLSTVLPSIRTMTLSTDSQKVVMAAAESGSGRLTLVPYKKVHKPLTKY